MEQTQTISITIPTSDVKFFKGLAKRMGWKTTTTKKKSGIQLAVEDVESGNVTKYESAEACLAALGI